MMRPVAAAALLVAASAEPMVAGGTLKLTWSDCGSVHGKATSIDPAQLILGQVTNIVGKGSVNEAVSGGGYEINMKAGIIPLVDHKGDLCNADTITLPGGIGTLQWKGVSCPLAAGPVEIDMSVTLSANIPASLASTTIKLTGTASNGDNLLCIQLNTVPEEGEEVHEARAAQINEISKVEGVLWTAGVNGRFAKEAPGASKSLCGVKGDWKEHIRQAVQKGKVTEFVAEENVAVPDSFDSEENWPACAKIIGDIRDQSNCGCCWAFGGAEAASDRMCIATGGKMQVPLSADDVCFCSSDDGCGGGQIDTPWQYIQDSGAVSGGQYQGSGPFGKGMCSDFSLPHCHHHGPQGQDPYPAEGQPGCPSQSSPQCPSKCDSSAAAPHSDFASDKYSFSGQIQTASGEANIQQMIMQGGPVETAFTVYSDFENYASGIYHHVSGSVAGGHAVKFVGWGVDSGVKYWKVANSWNPYWGEKGYFRIRRGNNEGGIEGQVIGSSATATWSKKGEEAVVV